MSIDQKVQDLGEVHLCVEIYLKHQGKVLMHRRSKNKKHFPGFLIGPGGHINEGENAVDAACRELEEETGITVHPSSLRLKYVGINHHVDTHSVWVNWCFLSEAANIGGKLRQSDEGISEWVDSTELIKLKNEIFPPTIKYLDHVLNDSSEVLYTSTTWDGSNLLGVPSRAILPT